MKRRSELDARANSDVYVLDHGTHIAVVATIGVVGLMLLVAPNSLCRLPLVCAFHLVTGFNCPFCGFTRDIVRMAHGAAPVHNVAAVPLAFTVFVVYPLGFLLATLLRVRLPSRGVLVRIMFVVLAGLLIANNV